MAHAMHHAVNELEKVTGVSSTVLHNHIQGHRPMLGHQFHKIEITAEELDFEERVRDHVMSFTKLMVNSRLIPKNPPTNTSSRGDIRKHVLESNEKQLLLLRTNLDNYVMGLHQHRMELEAGFRRLRIAEKEFNSLSSQNEKVVHAPLQGEKRTGLTTEMESECYPKVPSEPGKEPVKHHRVHPTPSNEHEMRAPMVEKTEAKVRTSLVSKLFQSSTVQESSLQDTDALNSINVQQVQQENAPDKRRNSSLTSEDWDRLERFRSQNTCRQSNVQRLLHVAHETHSQDTSTFTKHSSPSSHNASSHSDLCTSAPHRERRRSSKQATNLLKQTLATQQLES